MYKKLVFSFLSAMVMVGLSSNVSQACRKPILKPFKINHAKQTKIIQPKIRRNQDLASWQGQYSFVESLHGSQTAMYRSYNFRISLARCGWRSFIRINGHGVALDLQTQVVQLDDQTIGLFYQRETLPTFRKSVFQSGELLLRIRREKPNSKATPTQKLRYRVYFETLKPLVKTYQNQGKIIPTPKPLISLKRSNTRASR